MTEANLQAAFAGESQAHMRYLIFAEKAEKEGDANVGRLFRAIAFAEQVHATNHFKNLDGIGGTAENLQVAIDGETYEVEEMYPAYRAVAELQGEKGAARSTTWALEAEKVHSELYSQAKASVTEGKDTDIGEIYICEVCGWTGTGEKPDKCPLCGAKADRIRTF
ncbi:MAG: rubrerythrin family protein [Anaerolineae bacterium]|nr:rubrerythrin family protein [Anaerolineae bacterium]NIQ78171.1 rubrerythrin family protein [Anaerolineae bacterium]